jgi:hypothetical protein
MIQKEKLMKILSDEVSFSFGKVVKSSKILVEIELKINLGENVLETTLNKSVGGLYICSMKPDSFEKEDCFYSIICVTLFLKKENKEIIEQFQDFNLICEELLALLANEEFKKTSYFKMHCLYDPEFKKIFNNK